MIRQAVIWLIVVVVVGVVALDAIAVFQGRRTVMQNAKDAATGALSSYVDSGGDTALARSEAVRQLEENGSYAIGAVRVQPTGGDQGAVITVTAGRHVDTYLLHYFKSFGWAKKLLDPTSTQDSE